MTQTAENQSGHALRASMSSFDPEIDGLATELPPGRGAERKSLVAALFRHLVRGLDERLRRVQGIAEFSASRDCILRVEARRSGEALRLADGTEIRPEDALLELHLWNEHLPRIPILGPHLGWALRIRSQMRLSLAELARSLERRPDFAPVVALHARISWGRRARSGRMLSLARRFGFRPSLRIAPTGAIERIHDFWEDFLIWALICTFNPRSLRGGGLLRHRADLWMSRRELITRYGKAPQPRRSAPASVGRRRS
jgi:hypothetical protein